MTDQGYAGQELTHGMGNNHYSTRPWHLPEYCHPTNWTVREMCRFIVRRDPTRPSFWYMSFNHPHPPLTPLAGYMEMYRHVDVDLPFVGQWAENAADLPYSLRTREKGRGFTTEVTIRMARQAFYALCTHIDHQIRTVIGTLREEGLIENTIVLLTADHGDMLGNHRLWAKGLFYEESAKIPMLLVPTAEQVRQIGNNRLDDRLAIQADVMPTLLGLCDIPVPATVEGLSLVGGERRDHIYGEFQVNHDASRMVRDARYKLIYYPVGNRIQLFDLQEDPDEMRDMSDKPVLAHVRSELTQLLVRHLYGSDLAWTEGSRLIGLPDPGGDYQPSPNRGLSNQRGWRFK